MQAHITGNLTADPELRETPSGKRTARFTVAVDDSYRSGSGEWKTRPTMFFNVQAWGEVAHTVAALGKGAPVVVVGDWRADKWKGEDGKMLRTQYVLATAIGHDVGRAEVRAAARARRARTSEAEGEAAPPVPPVPPALVAGQRSSSAGAGPDDFFGDS